MSTVKTKLECYKCRNLFSKKGRNYKKHIAVCEGIYTPFVKQSKCKHCDVEFNETMSASVRANHTRWCDKNPKRSEYKITNNGSQLRTPEAVQKRIESLKKAHADGRYIESYNLKRGRSRTPHTEETKKLLQEKALASPHRRLRKKMIEYNGVWLDSTWEFELAKRLDHLQIKWTRPDPISWTDGNGLNHNYFPDFYLIDYNLYLDPKNPQALKVQKEKLEYLLTQHQNIVILDSLDKCKNFSI
jgi:hypothetical protein